MVTRKNIWDGMDKLEGKKVGSSFKNLNEEMKRQGVIKMKNLNPKIWKLKTDTKYYMAWYKKQKPMHNPHGVIVKTEDGVWTTFVDMGNDGGTSLISRGGTKDFNIFLAKKYMRENQYSSDLRWK